MDRVRRISEEIVAKYPGLFGTDYEQNKEQLNKVAMVHSKMLRNKIAGYITKMNGKVEVEEAPEQQPQAE